jgi:hypothetical protein
MEQTRELYTQRFGGFYESQWLNSDSVYNEVYNLEINSGVKLNLEKYDIDIDYNAFTEKVGKEYTNELESIFKKALGYEDFNMEFVRISSPREYNFATDQIVYNLTTKDDDKFFEVVRTKMREHYDELKDLIKERHTSYDGFFSFMSNNIDEWFDEVKENERRPYLECVLEYLAEIYLNDEEGNEEPDNRIVDNTIYERLYNDGIVWIEEYLIGNDEESQKALQSAFDAMH